MNNKRFATALHILTLLEYGKEELLSSDYIAGSININAAIVRKEIANLKKHQLVKSKEGKGGGNMLAKNATLIRLDDVYLAIQPAGTLGGANKPNPKCAVGKKMNQHLEQLFADADQAFVKMLHKTTLKDFVKQFQ